MTPTVAVEDKPVIKANVPIITFFARTWMLFIFMILANMAVLSQYKLPSGHTLFEILGAVLYVPALASVVMWVYLLMLHLFFRETLDKDAHDGVYITDWRALTSAERMWMNVVLRVGFFIGFCILCASMARG